MKNLQYAITINATRDHVWNTMLEADTYKKWAKAFSANSQFDGEWKEGNHMTFFDPNMGGTKALLERVVPNEAVLARHVSLVSRDGDEDTQSEMATKWIGSTESYTFEDHGGDTKVVVDITTHEDFENMFDTGWPKALDILKNLCESNK